MSQLWDERAAALLIIVLPLLLIWVFVIVDVLRQPRVSRLRRAVWIVACTLVWPMMIVYLLVRPTQGRAVPHGSGTDRTDPHARLVEAVLAHEQGRLSDEAMAAVETDLRRRAQRP